MCNKSVCTGRRVEMIHIPWGNGDFTEAPSNQVEKDELKLIRQREGHSRCCGERRYTYNICYRIKHGSKASYLWAIDFKYSPQKYLYSHCALTTVSWEYISNMPDSKHGYKFTILQDYYLNVYSFNSSQFYFFSELYHNLSLK